MKQPEQVFFSSSVSKITKLIELHYETEDTEAETISSMSQIPGWKNRIKNK